MSEETQAATAEAPAPAGEKWQLRLYVTGRTPKCVAALENLKRFCEEHMPGRYEIEVVADERIYEIDISPADGDVLDVDLEGDWGHHDCPHWGC